MVSGFRVYSYKHFRYFSIELLMVYCISFALKFSFGTEVILGYKMWTVLYWLVIEREISWGWMAVVVMVVVVDAVDVVDVMQLTVSVAAYFSFTIIHLTQSSSII